MQLLQLRTRTARTSDIHIHQCDCTYCDGTGTFSDPFSRIYSDCPVCEGTGFLEPTSQEAYDVYLSDLYSDVVHKMPGESKSGSNKLGKNKKAAGSSNASHIQMPAA